VQPQQQPQQQQIVRNEELDQKIREAERRVDIRATRAKVSREGFNIAHEEMKPIVDLCNRANNDVNFDPEERKKIREERSDAQAYEALMRKCMEKDQSRLEIAIDELRKLQAMV
jgi:histidinol phosphatase-like enzyme